MKFNDKKNPATGQGEWMITIEGVEWKKFLDKAKQSLEKNLEVPGFRKGKAPASEVKKVLTPAKIYNEAYRLAVQPAFEFALKQTSKIEPMNTPSPMIEKADESELIINFVFDLRPEVKLGAYKQLTGLVKEAVKVEESEVEEMLKNYQQRFAMEIPKAEGEKIADGDMVTFDFQGLLDGKPFDGGEAKDYKLKIGSHQFIPGFEEQMAGLGIGENQIIKVKFPEDYTEPLNGKDAEFVLNIKAIATQEIPTLDDELAKDVNVANIDTLEKLRNYVKENIQKEKQNQAKNTFVDEVLKKVIETSEIAIPKSAIDKELKHLKVDFEKQVEQQGMSLKDYKKATGMSDKDLDEELAKDAKFRLETYLITSEIQSLEKFEIADGEAEAKIQELADQFGIPFEQIKGMLPLEQVKAELQNEKLIDFSYNNN